MKKICSLLLIICLIFLLSACGGNETAADNDNGSSTIQNQTNVTDISSTEQSTDTSSSTTDNIGGSDSIDAPSSTISKPAITTKPETTKPSTPAHTHSYYDATCTAPAKCSCGATKGSALGHKWQEATCKAPKTCSVCKDVNGNKADHNYDNNTGICSVCEAKDENFKFKPLDIGVWEYSTKIDNLTLVCQIGFQWPDFTFFGLSRPATTQELNSGTVYTLKYNNVHYVCEFSSGEIIKTEEINDTIIITYEASRDVPQMELKRISNDTLVVLSIESDFPCSDSIKPLNLI